MADKQKQKSNCPNCGAPFDENGNCPYCGTKKQLESEIVITPGSITFSVK